MAVTTDTSRFMRYLLDLSWFIRALGSLILVLWFDAWPLLWQQLSLLIALLLLSYPARSVRAGMVYLFFLVGMAWALAILGVQHLVEVQLMDNANPDVRSTIWAAGIEETLKVVPLVVALLVPPFRMIHRRGATDLALLGAALGAGFGTLERAFYGSPFPGTPASPKFLGFIVMPDAIGGFVGHAASTGFIGLAIGGLLYALRWRRWMPVGATAVVLTMIWMVANHSFANQSAAGRPIATGLGWVADFDGSVSLTPFLIFWFILAAIIAESLLVHWVLRPFHRLGWKTSTTWMVTPVRERIAYVTIRQTIMRAKLLLLYVLAYRQLAYTRLHALGDGQRKPKGAAISVKQRVLEILRLQRLVLVTRAPTMAPVAKSWIPVQD